MRAVLQRVRSASVSIDNKEISAIENGLLVLLGVENGDDENDLSYIVDKISRLRIFEDEEEKMNLSIVDIHGQVLLVSQFTLCGDARKGRRPSFSHAAEPSKANELYELAAQKLREIGLDIQMGQFGADMDVHLVNQGPVTILLDSRKTF